MAASSESQEIQMRDVDYSKDVTAIVDMYINAFEGETQFLWAFQTTGKAHREALKLLFEGRLIMLEMYQKNIILVCRQKDNETIIGACAIQPNSCESTLYHQVRAGLLTLIVYYGFEALNRLKRLGTSSKEKEVEVDPTGGMLIMMAIEPKHQGQGIGSKLLINILNKWDDEGGGDLTLATQSEANVRFYQKHGFQVTHSTKFDDFTDWSMKRKRVKSNDVKGSQIKSTEVK
jgi:ribosomal protein S18 acetylase RimI-like enzyme